MQINYTKLRQDLIDYCGTAVFGGFPAAVVDLAEIENAPDEELLEIADKFGFDIKKYC